MNPLRAQAQGYRSYDELDFAFPEGCTVILGPNGSGKSSLIELVPLALFGSPSRSLADSMNVGHDELTIELTFEHSGTVYRVRRWYSAKGRGKSTLDLEEQSETGEWTPRTRETAAATQSAIESLLGISRETYLASAHLSQGDGDRFASAPPAQRKGILAEILQLGLWDQLLDRVRSDLRAVETELAEAAALAGRLEPTVADQPTSVFNRDHARSQRDGAAELVVDAEDQLEKAQERLATVAAKNERVLRLRAELAAAEQDRDRLQERLAQVTAAGAFVTDVRTELEEVAADAARIPMLEQELAKLQETVRAEADATRRRAELAAQVAQRETARQRLVDQALELHAGATDFRVKAQHLDDHIGEASACDRCGQTLGAEAAGRAAQSYRDEALVLDQRAAQIDTQASADLDSIAGLHEQVAAIEIPEAPDPAALAAHERALADARSSAEKRGQLQERLAGLEQLASERPNVAMGLKAAAALAGERQAVYAAARADVGDLTAAERAVDEAKAVGRDTRAALEARAAELARAEQRLEQIVAAQAELDQLRAQTADLHGRVDLFKLAERAYGRDGIPALILEASAIPTIETEANRIVAELGTGYRIELRTQRENKTGGLRESLDIVVYDGNHARPYETFSGGEKTRINLALRLALASLLAHRRGAESRILCIDEPDGLDSAGMDALVEVLRRLAGTFSKTLVVSHQPQLGSSFDQTLRVEKSGDLSRIAGDREAVLA